MLGYLYAIERAHRNDGGSMSDRCGSRWRRQRAVWLARLVPLAWLAMPLLVLQALPARADPVAEFYAGKTVRLAVAGVPGGGYDNIARAFARHYAAHIPGKPQLIVQSMAGGGGVILANWAYNVAARDGTVIAMPNLTVATNQVLAPATIKYDANRMQWLGNIEPQVMTILTWHTSPTKTIEDARRRETPMAATAKGSTLYQTMALANIVLGTRFRIALGYEETRVLAVERGEVEGTATSLQQFVVMAPHWLEHDARLINILVINSAQRMPRYPHVPTMAELTPDPEHRQMLEFLQLQALTGRAVLAPPEVPAERVAALRRAFDRTIEDRGFLADMDRLKVEVEASSGEQIQEAVRRVVATPPAITAKLVKAFE